MKCCIMISGILASDLYHSVEGELPKTRQEKQVLVIDSQTQRPDNNRLDPFLLPSDTQLRECVLCEW